MLRFGISHSIPQPPPPPPLPPVLRTSTHALLNPCAKSSGPLTKRPLELGYNKGIRVFIKAELFVFIKVERLCLFDPLR